ncbi:MAG: hypothetical protein CSB46_06510 [Micrococcales bacterium]|nr:MAG: hypothetical protein CSB46_06510 [Micrococcales bacterium]
MLGDRDAAQCEADADGGRQVAPGPARPVVPLAALPVQPGIGTHELLMLTGSTGSRVGTCDGL